MQLRLTQIYKSVKRYDTQRMIYCPFCKSEKTWPITCAHQFYKFDNRNAALFSFNKKRYAVEYYPNTNIAIIRDEHLDLLFEIGLKDGEPNYELIERKFQLMQTFS